jgi:hypothetical protein
MKRLFIASLVLFGICGCENPQYKNAKATSPDHKFVVGKVYTISCEMGGKWEELKTERHPDNAYQSRSGTWRFLTTEGESIWASNCSVRMGGK